ncbi:ATP-binding cassette domain-containing protein [Actinomadura napierensis]|uniref:Daunorubicin resistance protein DrrA family ABC transporter ATP-binding protein n=1 Tax=Actinomadura napierensis TaxID=267854 RepID=A0ABP5LRF0_9ACTN
MNIGSGTTGPAVEAAGLVREFRGGRRAIDGLDLRIERGEIYGLLGPNGAGKSTTVHVLTTLLPLTGGRAQVAGHDVAAQPGRVRRHIGVAMQDVALDPVLSAWEHVRLQAALHGLGRRERHERGAELIAAVNLADVAGDKVGTYSGGMKRRLDLALALLHRPAVLFLDEPTNGLDVPSREALWKQVRRLAREDGVTVLLTSQYLEEIDVLSDRVGIIDHGRMIAEATPDELKDRLGEPTIEILPADPAHRPAVAALLARFGSPATAVRDGAVAARVKAAARELPEIATALSAGDILADHIEVRSPSLNDVFRTLTGHDGHDAGDADGGRAADEPLAEAAP